MTLNDVSHDEAIFMAKLAESAERYDGMTFSAPLELLIIKHTEMATFMKIAFRKKPDATVAECNLLSVSNSCRIGSFRCAWRSTSSIEQRGKADAALARAQRERVEAEMMAMITEVCDFADEILPRVTKLEVQVHLLKMKADWLRYGAEFRRDLVNRVWDCYDVAMERSRHLPTTHPQRLGVALNCSVFHWELRNDEDLACSIAHSAFADAIHFLDDLDDRDYKDTTAIMGLLRDNLTLWTENWDLEKHEKIKIP